MSSNKYKCIKLVHGSDSRCLTVGNTYTLERHLDRFSFIGDDGEMSVWYTDHLKQFELVSPKVKGYIFCPNFKRGYYNKLYCRQYYAGVTIYKEDAYVYSMKEAQAIALLCKGWGGKAEGKWQVVYEQSQ